MMSPELIALLTTGLLLAGCLTQAAETPGPDPARDKAAFEQAGGGVWQEVFSDPCTGDWTNKWFLDGAAGTVTNSPGGMTLSAGPEFGNEVHHVVLWTKAVFEGDLKIEYDYTRLDRSSRCTTLLYIEASGSGKGAYARDIARWNDLRQVPAMSTYFNHMNAYAISYASFDSHIRGRRYMPEANGLEGTELPPDYFPKELFAVGVNHHFTAIKRDLFLRIENPDRVFYAHMTNTALPVITEGRVGLRHMFTRSACYRNFRVSIGKKSVEE